MKRADDELKKITAKIRAEVPDARAIIFFGSRVSGTFDEYSDYDVMVLVPGGVELDERKRIKRRTQAAFPKIKLDLVFGSERWLKSSLAIEPYYRFWLQNGVATYGNVPRLKRYPKLYKNVLLSRLNIIQSEIAVVNACSRNLHQEARGYLRILKQLILIEHALAENYSNAAIAGEINTLVGRELVSLLRDPDNRRRTRRPTLSRIEHILRRKFRAVKRQVINAELPNY